MKMGSIFGSIVSMFGLFSACKEALRLIDLLNRTE